MCGICGETIYMMAELREMMGEEDPDITVEQLPKEEDA